ncbi:phenylacetic acid degradation bifunctional protein PaaZ [Corynebacterium pygosceleis]|uniref:Phenylacetic acid degradation bifunctional protein PaaZ n=1 Tax=Corynebacterium pygosceleis TaxID=2800406 RepID=A0A9Q4CAC9_9CORY|nr:phenylacetic acid degradation bifunctional protein PaaZ [Corynebacterium pygosceleis]MCK7636455.1 phenylacetic acid degradation bifunctional protein PaaZ [Corynebacterium pygosceleis]MCK7675029.1 phenylacetic acid degradation bifunctional protein PaaZ [Corynebacterium pygosceleis]MCL0121440.1 phenylacetic acid degradation bifunctional protein PaaZ [Corynebacterium pygosceleis]MCX7469231.1 phenylacetic acid degradation bifunctional protein PaaZ [Corynebacterium pygosceleis]
MSPTTPPIVPSHLNGGWVTPENPDTVLTATNPSTGQPVARVSADGLDIAAAVEFARTTGQRSLQQLTIHERALRIKQLALHLDEHKAELYELSTRTGATKRDNGIDIDGGIGTMFVYSSKSRRELPNSTVIVDGPTEQLSRDGSFIGGHIYTSIPGVAVQINAFNFPVWGMLEKFAPAFIAGVPTIVKPAPQTGYVTERCVRLMVDSGLLPDGSLQLVSGGSVDLLEHLDYRDHLAFTGSARTANILRSHDAVLHGGVRFTAEADSLNAAVLGPDVTPDSPEFTAYIRCLFGELVAKAGQKCTAVRRAIVPAPLVDTVADALGAMIAEKVTVGAPDAEGTTMGPLVSAEQCDAVTGALCELIAAGATVHTGGPQTAEGAFLEPTILTFDPATAADPGAAVHSTEAFGPVVSVLGYDTLDDAVNLTTYGRGSLVATLCAHEPATVRDFTRGIAAHHGRVHLLDRDDARTSTGHGSPMPHLVHGGPGRAGGGEELGGVRGVKHYMQRSAIQGTPNHLTAVTGVWHTGADVRRVTRADVDNGTGVHPFRKSLAEIRVGDQFASELRTVTLDDITAFAEETGDKFYAHTDEEAATANPFFPRRVAHGYLLVSWAAGLFVDAAPGPVLANYGLENLRFLTPVTYDDSIRVELTAKRITPRVTDDYGEVCWDAVLYNQNDEIVATYDVLTLVAKER